LQLTANSHADIPSAVADLGHPKQNEDKLHEDQGDDPPPQLRDPAISISIFRQSLKTRLFNNSD